MNSKNLPENKDFSLQQFVKDKILERNEKEEFRSKIPADGFISGNFNVKQPQDNK